MKAVFLLLFTLCSFNIYAQQIKFLVLNGNEPIEFATIQAGDYSLIADSSGVIFLDFSSGMQIKVSAAGFEERFIRLKEYIAEYTIQLKRKEELDEVVISGTLRAVRKSESPVPVEIYTPTFIRKNPSPDLFSSLQMINGIRPQLNCSVCNTGDIHINGLEGAYTTILIDGMPLMSSLASVYGLFAIPPSIVDKIEVVKGPASSLYGSEAIGGLINVITKSPEHAPDVFAEFSLSSWKEFNSDLAFSYRINKNLTAISSVNFFNYTSPLDRNDDSFMDVTLQKRVSVFNKLDFKRNKNKRNSIALRYIYEDRWGGELNWNKSFRGGDDVYGEHIETSRMEITGQYDLPVKEDISLAYSMVHHRQNSAYGTTIFNAKQSNAFARLTWTKSFSDFDFLSGISSNYQWYDDNTPVTFNSITNSNKPDNVWIPGIFTQAEYKLQTDHLILGGLRLDYDQRHGSIFTPRLAYKYNLTSNDILRINMGTGFRVVNIFTEDHAALTGSRDVVIVGNIKPEKSINLNLNYVKNIILNTGWLNLDASAWFTRFSNKIAPDYSQADKIIYSNLKGYAISKGVSLNSNMSIGRNFKATAGFTIMDLLLHKEDERGVLKKEREMLSENWTGTWTLTYILHDLNLTVDYTGNIYGPMLLPLVGETDPRPEESPVWSIQNIQFTWKSVKNWEIYGGIKNLLDFTPAKNIPFLISRAHDPFDKKVIFDNAGNPVATPENPYALTFDPAYIYAPNQGIRGYIGVRYTLRTNH